MKSTTKIMFLMIITITIGIGMPTAFSIGTGQHQFIQPGSSQVDMNTYCARCHNTDTIQAEMALSTTNLYYGTPGVTKVHSSLGCADCHAIDGGYAQEIGGVRDPTGKVQHAAALPSCLKCHITGNYQMSKDVTSELNNPTEAHKNFKSSIDDDIQCIGCHTGITIIGSISYTYSDGQTISGIKMGK